MAENILGILFVTSTSQGRSVFRYPPDPLSPYPRLSQPIYPSSTYTARDNVFGDVSRRRLFPDEASASASNANTGPRKSSATSGGGASSVTRSTRLGRSFGASTASDGGSGNNRYLGGSRGDLPDWGRAEEDEDDGDRSDGSGDSGEGMYYMGGAIRVPLSGKRIEEEVINAQNGFSQTDALRINTLSNSRPKGVVQERMSPKNGTGDSRALPNVNNSAPGVQVHGAPGVKYDASIESQYSFALGYSLDFLSDMLTPSRAACNRKFELCVDELVFIGHPVTIGADGTWGFPKDRAQSESSVPPRKGTDERGRRRDAVGHSHLRTVVEGSGSEGASPTDTAPRNPLEISPDGRKRTETSTASTAKSKSGGVDDDDDCPVLNMFHMVIIVDKPDPRTAASGGTDHIAPSEGFMEIYREIAFKWTAAAYALQVKDNWVARESWEMAKARERSMAEGISVEQCCISMYRGNLLERALQDLSFNLWKFRTAPVNPLYAHLPSTVTVSLADLPISMVLSPRSVTTEETWAHIGSGDHDYDVESEMSSDSGDHNLGEKALREIKVEPWQTLLLIEDRAKERAKEMAAAVVGLGNWTPTSKTGRAWHEGEEGMSALVLSGKGERRGSKETQAEEDESNLMRALIEACDVTKPLADLAHTLRFDLDGIVIPLARELVQNKKAILIDTINARLRTIVMPSTIVEHSSTLEDYIRAFHRAFPSLPSLTVYLSQISAAPKPFRDLIPSASHAEYEIPPRHVYLDSLIWLLRRDLVIQVHTYVRIWARVDVKVIAWKRLWHRRRLRWVASKSGSLKTRSERSHGTSSATSTAGDEGLDIITPRADRGNPLDRETSMTQTTQNTRSRSGTVSDSQQNHSARTPASGSAPPTRTSSFPDLSLSFLDYDPELELDSDVGEADLDRLDSMNFSMDSKEPTRDDVPKFEGSFIFRPARAVKEEMRWLRVIREGADEVWASKFDLCVQYFDGATSFEEISYRTGLRIREIEWIVKLFKEDVVVLLHP